MQRAARLFVVRINVVDARYEDKPENDRRYDRDEEYVSFNSALGLAAGA